MTVGAIVLRVQSHYFFAALPDMSSGKKYDLIMVVHEYSLVLSGLPSAPHDQIHSGKLVHGLDHQLTLHSGLHGNVIVAVPAVAKLCAIGFAEKQVDQHLPWNKPSKHMSVHEKPTAVK